MKRYRANIIIKKELGYQYLFLSIIFSIFSLKIINIFLIFCWNQYHCRGAITKLEKLINARHKYRNMVIKLVCFSVPEYRRQQMGIWNLYGLETESNFQSSLCVESRHRTIRIKKFSVPSLWCRLLNNTIRPGGIFIRKCRKSFATVKYICLRKHVPLSS